MRQFFSFFLNDKIELTDEREQHIKNYHPDIIPFFDLIERIITAPDEVRSSVYDPEVYLFYKFFPEVCSGKFIVVAVKIDKRKFILTAYITSKIKLGRSIWKKE